MIRSDGENDNNLFGVCVCLLNKDNEDLKDEDKEDVQTNDIQEHNK